MNIFVLVPDIYKNTLDATFVRNILKNNHDVWFSDDRKFNCVEYSGVLLPYNRLNAVIDRVGFDKEILIFTFTPEPEYNQLDRYIDSLTAMVHYMLGYFNIAPVIINLGPPKHINESERAENLEKKGNDENDE